MTSLECHAMHIYTAAHSGALEDACFVVDVPRLMTPFRLPPYPPLLRVRALFASATICRRTNPHFEGCVRVMAENN